MDTAKLSSKHQITVPKQVREQLRVGQGDRISFEPTGDGRFILGHAAAIRKSDGAARRRLKQGLKPRSQKELDDTVTRAVSADDQRIRRGA